jgi:hypothetical protein
MYRAFLLLGLLEAFEKEAQSIAKIIVREKNITEDHRRTIKSLDAGGIAGGVKYSKSNIFFKFTFDQEGLYAGDQFAAKAAGRELQGLTSYLDWILSNDETGLFTPLQVWVNSWCLVCERRNSVSLTLLGTDSSRRRCFQSLPTLSCEMFFALSFFMA